MTAEKLNSAVIFLRGGTMRKGIRFGFVLTDDEKCALSKLAELEGGLSEAATVRRLIRRAAREAGVWKLKKTTCPITGLTHRPNKQRSG
jgi:hypothetical protein